MKAFLSRQFAAFLITGGIAAAVNFLSRIGYDRFMDFSAAVVMAYITGMVTAYVLARLFVFAESQTSTAHAASWFVVVNLFAVAQTWLVSMGLAYYLLPSLGVQCFVPELAHLAGVVVPVFTSFLGHKHFSFKS